MYEVIECTKDSYDRARSSTARQILKMRYRQQPKGYGYIKNHKKTVKNGQARTRESEEYKKKPKNQSRSQKSQALRLHLCGYKEWCRSYKGELLLEISMKLGLAHGHNSATMCDSHYNDRWILFASQLHESTGGLPKTKLVSHSYSLAGSTSAMEVSIPIAFVLLGREHECNESFKLGRPPALS
ncbi:hypothetical protein Tco_0396312 [Tanacetum coccineum]